MCVEHSTGEPQTLAPEVPSGPCRPHHAPPRRPPASAASLLVSPVRRSRTLKAVRNSRHGLPPLPIPSSNQLPALCVHCLDFFLPGKFSFILQSCPIAASPGKSFTFLPPYPHPLNKVRSLLYNPSGLPRRCITANITVLLHSLLHMLCTPPPRTPHGQPLCPAIGHGAWTMCWKRGSEQGCMLCTFNDTRGVAVQHKVSWGLYSHEQTNCDG